MGRFVCCRRVLVSFTDVIMNGATMLHFQKEQDNNKQVDPG